MLPLREWEIVGEVAIAMLLGAGLAFDRTAFGRSAARTHMIVAGASALLVGLGFSLIEDALVSRAVVAVDPVRIIQAIVVGVSLLGAGISFREDRDQAASGVLGAASVLMSSGVGVAVALRQFTLAVATVVLVAAALRLMRRFDKPSGGKGVESGSSRI
jgi:putative Mg2+ transporter-C (MgtC) family protein